MFQPLVLRPTPMALNARDSTYDSLDKTVKEIIKRVDNALEKAETEAERLKKGSDELTAQIQKMEHLICRDMSQRIEQDEEQEAGMDPKTQ